MQPNVMETPEPDYSLVPAETPNPHAEAMEARGGDALVIYIWKRKGWRKYRVRES